MLAAGVGFGAGVAGLDSVVVVAAGTLDGSADGVVVDAPDESPSELLPALVDAVLVERLSVL